MKSGFLITMDYRENGKQRHSYGAKNVRLIKTSRWEYPIPKSRAYWEKFCDEEEKRLIRVRDPFPNLSYLPLVTNNSFEKPSLKPTSKKSSNNFTVSTNSLMKGNIKFTDPILKSSTPLKSTMKSKIISTETKQISEPLLTVSPPTPSKRSTKPNFTKTGQKTEMDVPSVIKPISDKIQFRDNRCPIPSTNKNVSAPNLTHSDRKIYPKGSCPLHRGEPPVKIFDDDIEKFLIQVESPYTTIENLNCLDTKHKSAITITDRTSNLDMKSDIISEIPSTKPNERNAPSKKAHNDDECNETHIDNVLARHLRTPKLGTATLMPSFGRTVFEHSNECSDKSSINDECIDVLKTDTSAKSLLLPKLSKFRDPRTNESVTVPKNHLHVPLTGPPGTRRSSTDYKASIKEKPTAKAKTFVNKEHYLDDSKKEPQQLALQNDTIPEDIPKTVKEQKEPARNRHSMKYSIRAAYKALKFLTSNKTLDFDPQSCEDATEQLSSKSSTHSDVTPEERLNKAPNEEKESKLKCSNDPESASSEHLFQRDIQKRLKKKWKKRLHKASVMYDSSSDDTAKSIITSTRLRSSSGPSCQFAFSKVRQNVPTESLAGIPKMSLLPRTKHDKCFSCLHKPFAEPEKSIVSLPRTVLQKMILERKPHAPASESESDSESTSITLPDINNEFRYVLSDSDKESDDCLGLPKDSSNEINYSVEVDQVRATTPDGVQDLSLLTSKYSSTRNDLNLMTQISPVAKTPKSISVSSDRSVHSPSPGAQSPDESDSPIIFMNEDQSKSKYVAPCHAPTVFCPSMASFKALKSKKASTFQSCVTADEPVTMTKYSTVDDDYDDVGQHVSTTAKKVEPYTKKTLTPEAANKDTSTIKAGDAKDEQEKGEAPKSRKVLRKGMSVTDKLGSGSISTKESERMLRRGSSCLTLAKGADVSYRSLSPVAATESADVSEEPETLIERAIYESLSRGSTSRLVSKLPRFSAEHFVTTLKRLHDENAKPDDILSTLSNEFFSRVVDNYAGIGDANVSRCNKLAEKIIKLLVESKRYLRPDKFPSGLVFSSKQPPEFNSRLLRKVLPLDSYNLIAPILDMPQSYPKLASKRKHTSISLSKRPTTEESSAGTSFELRVHPPSTRRTGSSIDDEKIGDDRFNPYALFLRKPRRKVVTWRPLTERELKGYDPEATLKMRARNITNKICQDFCQWLRSLGGTDQVIDEEVLRDMFEIDFTADAVRTMQVSIKEMPMVPKDVALARQCPGAGELAMTKKYVMTDISAESRPKKIRAFGATMPWELQFVPPANRVREKWLQCENVPRELETMDVVWRNITHLESVQGFMKWLRDHPEVPPPEALKSIPRNNVQTVQQDDEALAQTEFDMSQIATAKVAEED